MHWGYKQKFADRINPCEYCGDLHLVSSKHICVINLKQQVQNLLKNNKQMAHQIAVLNAELIFFKSKEGEDAIQSENQEGSQGA